MVLQHNSEVSIWGWAKPNQVISLKASWNMEKIQTKANNEGSWIFKLDSPPPGGPYTIIISGEDTITLKNIMVGEVWVCSGQSNMHYPVDKVDNSQIEIESANYPDIRFFTVQFDTASNPQKDCMGSWKICSPQTVSDFSAVSYFFGRNLHKELDVPIGLIHTSVGGSTAEAWIKREFIEKNPELNFLLKQFEETKREYKQKINEWELEKKESEKGIDEPSKPLVLKKPHKGPYVLYNAMIYPLLPYAVKGVIWYQGEANAKPGKARNYIKIFPALINSWRKEWGQENLPFYFVQLPNFREEQKEPVEESDWAIVREAQLMTLQSVPNTGMAITIDLGEKDDIHPSNKQDVGKRLALWPLKKYYGKDLVFSGPVFKSMEKIGEDIRIHFQYTGSGLISEGDKPLKGFAIAGKDKEFFWADAKIIDCNTVSVTCNKVTDPIAVRYGWADNPICNLYNEEGLPASPFRTDDWDSIP
jgi:sialate O-acetylesterase